MEGIQVYSEIHAIEVYIDLKRKQQIPEVSVSKIQPSAVTEANEYGILLLIL